MYTNVPRLAGLALVLSVMCWSPAAADYIAPGEVLVKTKAYTPEHADFGEGVLSYSISWQGIPVAFATVLTERDNQGGKNLLHVQASVKTGRAIDMLYRLRHRSDSFFEAESFRPSTFYFHQTENSRIRYTQVAFEPDGKIRSKRWKNGKEEASLEFKSDNFTFDPVSAAFLARSLPIAVGEEVSFDVFNGKHRYLISFTVAGKEKVKRGEERVEAFKVIPRVKKLTDTKEDKRLQSAVLWISADERRDILRLESKVWLGKVVAELESSRMSRALPRGVRASLATQEPEPAPELN